jgi:carbon storage regulator
MLMRNAPQMATLAFDSKRRAVRPRPKLVISRRWVVDPVIHKEEFMLVLSRQSDETIIIGDNIRVTIVEVRGDKVRIGIDAPRDVAVHRQEIYDAIRRDAEKAAHPI